VLHDTRVDYRAALGDGAEGIAQGARLAQPFLEDVAPSGRSLREQRHHVCRLHALAEDDHTQVGMGMSQLGREPNSLVGVGRRHADVGQHDVRFQGGDRLSECVQVVRRRQELDAFHPLQEPRDPLADEVVGLPDDDADRHHACCEARRRRIRQAVGQTEGCMSPLPDGDGCLVQGAAPPAFQDSTPPCQHP